MINQCVWGTGQSVSLEGALFLLRVSDVVPTIQLRNLFPGRVPAEPLSEMFGKQVCIWEWGLLLSPAVCGCGSGGGRGGAGAYLSSIPHIWLRAFEPQKAPGVCSVTPWVTIIPLSWAGQGTLPLLAGTGYKQPRGWGSASPDKPEVLGSAINSRLGLP